MNNFLPLTNSRGFRRKAVWLPLAAAVLAVGACDSGKDAQKNKAPEASASAVTDAATKAGKDWTATVVATPEGGYLMGNPEAKVKLVEFASFTCPHCRDFFLESQDELINNHVKAGRVAYEYRPFPLNPQDVVAVSLAQCDGPERFFTWTDALYRHQESWIRPYMDIPESELKQLAQLPFDQQLLGLAKAGKFHDFAKVRGMSQARFDACQRDEDAVNTLMERQQKAVDDYKLTGTPSFLLNGKKLENVTSWRDLEPQLLKAIG